VGVDDMRNDVPICDKIAWTIPETAQISNIGENKLYELVKNPRCPFVLFVGNKRLIKKKEFEKYISENVEI
jgi:excisionase family DNA binding protein